MKKLSIIGLFIFALFSFNSCETEDDVVFVVNEAAFSFTNSFSAEYVLTPQAAGNLGERFTWNSPALDVPTNISYELQKSISGDFSDMEVVGTTNANEIAITIGDMLGYAAQAGLDNDPATPNPDTGNVSFRIKSSVGTTGGLETFSDVAVLTLRLPEQTTTEEAICDLDQYFLVGAAVKFTGWDWATPQRAVCTGTNVYTVNVDLVNNVDGDGNFRFFTTETDWGSGINYPGFSDDGWTIDSMFEDAMDGDNNFLFTGPSGKYFLTIDALNKTITLDNPTPQGTCDLDQYWAVGAGLPDAGWDWATPVQLMCEADGVYSGWVNYTSDGDANFRFFTTATDWGSGINYPGFADEGYTIDANFENANDGDLNFKFIGTTGQYFTTIDTVAKTITLE
ncbi:SusE domain-containing protein [Ichthyenterobacterium sp. W332]|uniref:SusE domain-containing protein n=1 Tax=Microcosmobacter mediterraneus TaxID=3075607 RepID=A0ABU2YL96_9FLAO|nr:SusE domain-containing protein [Ichthyenterobacterium sp. W332]MDT0558935.1 SusE domain-containing protein [Ichthyenterobacterium sp. W332]